MPGAGVHFGRGQPQGVKPWPATPRSVYGKIRTVPAIPLLVTAICPTPMKSRPAAHIKNIGETVIAAHRVRITSKKKARSGDRAQKQTIFNITEESENVK